MDRRLEFNFPYGYHGANCSTVSVKESDSFNYYKLYNDYGEMMKEAYGYEGVFWYLKRLEDGKED